MAGAFAFVHNVDKPKRCDTLVQRLVLVAGICLWGTKIWRCRADVRVPVPPPPPPAHTRPFVYPKGGSGQHRLSLDIRTRSRLRPDVNRWTILRRRAFDPDVQRAGPASPAGRKNQRNSTSILPILFDAACERVRQDTSILGVCAEDASSILNPPSRFEYWSRLRMRSKILIMLIGAYLIFVITNSNMLFIYSLYNALKHIFKR